MFDTVLVAGLGLMGGSMAKTIKARTLSRVLGWNRTRATAEQALADGSILSLSAFIRRQPWTGCLKICRK